MSLLNNLRIEIAVVDEMENRYNQLCNIIHTEYYRKIVDNRAIDRTRDDYPAFLLRGILENKEWE